jgi:hypothetical protein
VKQSLGLTVDVFDATLLISTVYKDKATCLAWGDGYVIFVTDNREIIAYEVKYSSGAPYYLSYEMSPVKKEAYQQMYGNGLVDLNTFIISPDGIITGSSTSTSPVAYSHTLLKEAYAPGLKFITLSSDGLDTYKDNPNVVRPDDVELLIHGAEKIIPQVVAYKGIVGEFVIRRMQRMKSDMEKALIIHLDDVSCATIAF